jgi:LacI family transcriptional regulator
MAGGDIERQMVKQKDIAKALGISIGTVDRALHNRGRIDKSTQRAVLKTAERMGYRTNLAARALALGRRLRISINLPQEIAYFYDEVRGGVRSEYDAIAQDALTIEFRTFPRLGVGEQEAFKDALDSGVHGIVAAFSHQSDLPSIIERAAEQKVKLLNVVTGTSKELGISSVSNNPRSSGATAAGLIAGFTRSGGTVAVETGDMETWEHREKVNSFRNSLKLLRSELKVLPIIETNDRDEIAYRETVKLIDRQKDLIAFYVSTSNSLAIIRALKLRKLLGKIVLITTDLSPGLLPHLRTGRVTATIHERPRVQGELALRSMYEMLSDYKCPLKHLLLQPHVVMGANLDEFMTKPSAGADGMRR